jgi:hypothetical protein
LFNSSNSTTSAKNNLCVNFPFNPLLNNLQQNNINNLPNELELEDHSSMINNIETESAEVEVESMEESFSAALNAPQSPLAAAQVIIDIDSCSDSVLYLDSVKEKRKAKMKRHQYRKRMKEVRFDSRNKKNEKK